MLKLMKKRDRKEQEIDIAFEHEKINKEGLIRMISTRENIIKRYQEWKKENNIEGIKY